ncbi:flagellar biosynthesis anti-sigma factor FlgM [Candidatus Accumulibacter sp. ACC003]|uniref:flagellar biosynthesis anti-sigma factor FlgM n=1 Tax=Candidatus Accumulibacter sp. ACC003 TaxID=2823334 RepID=UPI0025C25215|nr:flagellar biosynthesis anti-sigma factor FlgM [Candidatus Accumulibacter sp. ACC003]
MKIDSSTSTASALGGSNEARSRTGASGPAAVGASEVHLSALAEQLQVSGEATSFDATRVSEIKQAIADGRFSINVDAVAERLITSASELIAAQAKT